MPYARSEGGTAQAFVAGAGRSHLVLTSLSSTALLLLLLSGIVLGGFIGEMTAKVPGLSWLNFGESFGLNDPLILNLGILVITFGLSIRITMASIIGVIIAILIYHFL